ncbi:MAG TPA: stage II sporulation protein P [Syntrophomonadaceae bacterium]|nr:stage II sporulation protein P [Syntrophomonadaceae bacterium]
MINTYNFFKFAKTILLLQVFLVCLVLGISLDMKTSFCHISKLNLGAVFNPFSLVKIDSDDATSLVKNVNLVMASKEVEAIAATSYFDTLPQGFLAANITALEKQGQLYKHTIPAAQPIEIPAIKKDELDGKAIISHAFDSSQTVVFYCTHSAETYRPDSGKAKLEGKRGLVNNVADNLSKQVKKRGLNSEFINTIHDYPIFNESYMNSKVTVKNIIDSNKEQDILAIFDIHRDSIPGSKNPNTIKINGQESARILIIVGTDERKPHPNWKENLSFAENLLDEGEKVYPGLIRGIRTHPGTYNQEFHNRALLFEVGNDYNTFEQAKYASELFADILIEVLKKEVD